MQSGPAVKTARPERMESQWKELVSLAVEFQAEGKAGHLHVLILILE
jgi:hypothetical protein